VRVQQVITDFSTGEISPLSEGRVRTAQYNSACRKLENFLVSARGGVRRRNGMSFISKTKNGQPARLIPFVFNRAQSYVIEVGDKYMRFHRSDGTIVEGPAAASLLEDKFGDRMSRPRLGMGPEARAEGDPYEIATPYTIDQIFDLHFAQANDVMIIVHEDHPPKRLGRYGGLDWRLEDPEWVDSPWTAETGYPRTVVFFQQRLWFGGTTSKPQTLWSSRVGDFYTFTINDDPEQVAPDDALELGIASYTQERIEWLSSEKVLLIGTTGSEQRLTPDQYISINNVPNIARMSSYGGRHIQPVFIGELTVFVQGSGRQVRSYSQNTRTAIEQYVSRDMAWFAEHITDSGVIAQSYELVPDSILWQVRADGTLISMTHDPSIDEDDYSAMGWSRHPTQGEVISVTTIPNFERDETWVVTRRNGADYCVEYMDPDLYTDSCLTTPPDNETELLTVGNLDHLEGLTVSVVVDDAVQTEKVVTGGQVTLDLPGKKIEIGLPYNATLETTPYNDGNSAGTNLGTSQRWAQIYAKLVDSALPLIEGERPAARTPSTPMGSPESLRTGDYDIVNLGWDLNGTIEVVADLPKKCQLVALFGIYQSNAQ
jgi:hypothetical protein